MNTNNGWVRPILDFKQDEISPMKRVVHSQLSPSHQKILKETGRTKIGVNEKCPCGSGKKFKKCCKTWTQKDVTHIAPDAGKEGGE